LELKQQYQTEFEFKGRGTVMGNSSNYVAFLFVTLSLLTLNALALYSPSTADSKLLNNSSIALSDPSNHLENLEKNSSQENNGLSNDTDIFVYHSHPAVINYTYEDLCNKSDTIVIGTVKRIHSRWGTIDGKLHDPTTNFIYTDNIINVETYLKNPLTSKEILVSTMGGTVGNISRIWCLEANFKIGEKVLLFLYKNNFTNDVSSEPSFLVTDYYLGKFTLTDDGKATILLDNTSTTLAELLNVINQTENRTNYSVTSTINQTENRTNYSVTAMNEVAPGNQEGNINSTMKSKNAPFLSPVWVIAVVFFVVVFLRKIN
jgi:hypothetical protein